MRRRRPEDDSDAELVAQMTQEAVWWAERAQVNQPLTLDECPRYAVLTWQRTDGHSAMLAVLDTATAPAVARSCSELARAEYARWLLTGFCTPRLIAE